MLEDLNEIGLDKSINSILISSSLFGINRQKCPYKYGKQINFQSKLVVNDV